MEIPYHHQVYTPPHLDVTAILSCVHETITIDITYPDYFSNWFGLPFSETMIGDAIVYTTGKQDNQPSHIYAYDLLGQNHDWTEISTEISNTEPRIRIIY